MATVTAGLRRRRPLEKAASFVVLLVLPLSQRPVARWGYPHPRSDAVSICVVLVRNATLHPRQMVPSKAASMRRAALLVAARGRPQAARRHRVTAAWCLLQAVLCTVVRCNRRRSSAWHPIVWRCRSDVHRSRLKRAVLCAWRFGPSPSKSGQIGTGVSGCSHRHVGICRRHICIGGVEPAVGGLVSVHNCRSLSAADTRRRFGFQRCRCTVFCNMDQLNVVA
jgi:hypothetical protein